MRTQDKLSIVMCVAAALYVGSYYRLSRIGFREADRWNVDGFYFCDLTNPELDDVNQALATFYRPLIAIDVALGTGRRPASAPLRGLH
jgi:hypothetical protein